MPGPPEAKSKRKSRTYIPFGRVTGVQKWNDTEALAPSRRLSIPAKLPPATSTVTSVEKVLETVRAHLRKHAEGTGDTSASQPKFDDLTLYDVSEAEENKLWECEVKRLIQTVKDMSEPLEFKNYGSFLQPDTKAAYEGLSTLADRLLVNLHICRQDNEVVFLQFSEKKYGASAHTNSERVLERFVDNAKVSMEDSKEATISKSTMISYFALVDYITAVAARFAVLGADHDTWQRRALSGLAKYSAKLKVLSRNSEAYALRSIDVGKRFTTERNVMRTFGISRVGVETNLGERAPVMGLGGNEAIFDSPHGFVPWNRNNHDHSGRAKELEALLQQGDPAEDFYFSDIAFVFHWTSSTLFSMVQRLKTSSLSGFPVDGFDICSVVYKRGTSDSPLPIFIHQDRDGEISGSSYLNFIKHAYAGFALVQQAVDEIQKRKADGKGLGRDELTGKDPRSGTYIMAQKREGSEEDMDETAKAPLIPLTTLAEVVTVMVPLLFTDPIVVRELQSSLRLLGELLSIDVEEKLTPRSPDFTAAVSLRTNTFELLSSSCLRESDFRSLSMSLVVHRDRQIPHPKVPANTDAWSKTSKELIRQRLREVHQRRERLIKEGREWDIEETSVRVQCPQYVYTVLTICGILVAGGLTSAFTMGQRVRGVDPFGIATFSWVVAGFIVVVSKSIRVNDWPWRDFLLGRVTCRSLSELQAVTGLNDQDLLLYLLTKESENVLITRGPYNKMFTRKGDSGFSIDIKPEMRTLFSSGVIFVKVSMSDGSALVCLDLRRGAEKRDVRTEIRHNERMCEGDLVCQYPPRPGDMIQDVELSQLTEGRMYIVFSRWRKILGIYHSAETKVR
ncbi:hypothetical protein K469DRAFT_706494 [Zopfia rhizophila CBS 207.26]|uniref:Uncharacterized protein n=1 Tax=Zopfia rhizophila CBS 207.26 TaxID=1314779 RepID=A0A6A6E3K3_9PEZI|nr:hypothetical protein K469DRAFT_706494 [Zopfia rhizophila CBS 207.26]